MKKFLLLFLAILLVQFTTPAQQGWFEQTSGTTANLNSVYFVDENIGLAVGDSGLIIKTTNGGDDWNTKVSGTTDDISCVQFTNNNIGWALISGGNFNSGGGKLLNTSNQGEDWEIAFSDSQYNLRTFYFLNNDTGWISCIIWNISPPEGVILKTINGGENWQIQGSIPTNFIYKDIFFLDKYNGWMLAGWAGPSHSIYVLRTTDGGENWIEILLSESECCYDRGINSIYFIDEETGWLTRGPYFDVGGGFVAKTTDGGYNWTTQAHANTSGGFSSVYFLNADTGWIVGGSYGYSGGEVLITTNGGDDWIQQYFENQRALTSICFIDSYTGWAVGSRGIILKTTTGGVIPVELTSFTASTSTANVTLNWSTATETNNSGFEIERKLDKNEWERIGFVEGHGTTVETQNYLYADNIINIQATSLGYRLKQIDYDGTYEYSDEVFVDNPAPSNYALQQNYPNPFNPNTKIRYSVPQSSNIVIKVFDILGNEIETLVNEEKPVGTYEITWNAESLTSGVYFYRLQANDFTQIKKMILLR